MKKIYITVGIVIIALAMGFIGSQLSVYKQTVGAASGTDFSNEIFLLNGVTVGGGVYTYGTTSTSYTLPAAALNSSVIALTPNGASLTVTLPGTSTLTSIVPKVGDKKTVYVRNATTTANVNITVVGGTGTTLKGFSTSSPKVITGDTDAANYAELTLIRRASDYVDVLFSAVTD